MFYLPQPCSSWRPDRTSLLGPAMTTDLQPPADPRDRRRRLTRLVIVVGALGAGLLCGTLPVEYQGICRAAAKVVAFFAGGG